MGWDKLREERFSKMKELEIIPPNTKLSEAEGNLNKLRGPLVPYYINYYPWDSCTDAQKDSLDLEMAVFAAIIDRMDQNIGRVLEKLEKEGELENTLVLFLVDNGSCPHYSNKIKDVQPGPADSYWSLRSTWANLGNTPFRQYKQSGFDGGSHTPFIAYWPGKIAPNTITSQPGHVVDILPTFLDIVKTNYPEEINGFPTLPLHGKSLLPIFMGEKRVEPEFFISGLKKHRMFRKGDYKIVRMNGEAWKLFNIKDDPSETINLAQNNPDKLQELIIAYKNKSIEFN